jgi:hypothetical protein
MKRAAVCLIVGAVLGGGVVSLAGATVSMPFREKYKEWKPLPMGPFKTTDPFIGKWEIDKEKSNSYPRVENIEFKITGEIQDYKNDTTRVPGPTHRIGYETRFNEMLWVPYIDEATGKPNNMYVMTIKVDDRTHFRMIRKLDGTAGGTMLRRLAANGKSYMSVGMDENGNIQYKRTYKKVDAFTLTAATADTPIKVDDGR